MKTKNLVHRSFSTGGNTLKTLLYVFMAIALMFNLSCSPEDGKDGEPGPQGEQGPAGQDGNANVVASDWFEVQFDDMSGATPPTWGEMYLQNDDIPEVDMTDYDENGGVILMYLKQSMPGGTIVFQLPYYSGTTEIFHLLADVPGVLEGGLAIRLNASDVSGYENNPDITFKYVLVPANVAAKQSQGKTKNWNDIDVNNYEEVIEFLGLEP